MIRAQNLGFRFDKSRWIFRHVDLELHPGEITAVLGPNARGKTTFVSCLAGLKEPSEGEVTHTGVIGYVPQSHSTGASFPVFDMVLMGRARFIKAYSSPKGTDRKIAREAMERIGISYLASRDYRALSGGERQLVLIARALTTGCQAMILDEPASALDLKNQAKVLQALQSLADDGLALMMTTHHPDHALRIANRVILIAGAEDIRIGPTDELLTGQTLTELYELNIKTEEISFGERYQHIIVPDFGVQRKRSNQEELVR